MSEDDTQAKQSKFSAPMRWPLLTGVVAGVLGGLLIWGVMPPSSPKKYQDVSVSVDHLEEDHEEAAEEPKHGEHEATPAEHEEAHTAPAEEPAHEAVAETPAPEKEIGPAPAADVSVVAEVAVVIADMGLNRRVTEAADKALPAETTMAVSAYATDAAGTATAFKETGRDVWLQVAAQSKTGGIDPGPLALSASEGTSSNADMLKRQINLVGGTNIIGIYVPSDADITSDPNMWRELATDLIADNEMILDGTDAKVSTSLYMQKSESKISAYLKSDLVVSAANGPAALQKSLMDAIPVILNAQQAIVVISNPSIGSMETVGAWVNSLRNKGIRLVPASRFTGLTGQ